MQIAAKESIRKHRIVCLSVRAGVSAGCVKRGISNKGALHSKELVPPPATTVFQRPTPATAGCGSGAPEAKESFLINAKSSRVLSSSLDHILVTIFLFITIVVLPFDPFFTSFVILIIRLAEFIIKFLHQLLHVIS